MKIFNKIIWSKEEPVNKKDIWFDGSGFKIYTEGYWQTVSSGGGVSQDIPSDMNNDFNKDF